MLGFSSTGANIVTAGAHTTLQPVAVLVAVRPQTKPLAPIRRYPRSPLTCTNTSIRTQARPLGGICEASWRTPSRVRPSRHARAPTQRLVQPVGDPPLRTVRGVLVVQGGSWAGVPGALHQLGQGGPGARGERHRRVALVVPRQVVAADGSTGSREHRRAAAAGERGAVLRAEDERVPARRGEAGHALAEH